MVSFFKKYILDHFSQKMIFLFFGLALLFGVLHRGGISLQANLIYAFFIGMSGIVFVLSFVKKRKKYKENSVLKISDCFLLLFSVFYFLSFIFSKTKNYGLVEVFQIFGAVMIFFIVSKNFLEKKYIDYFINFSIFAATLSTWIGFDAYLNKAFDRFAGSFQDFREIVSAYPNAYSDFLLLLLPFIVWRFFQSKKTVFKILWGLLLLFNLTGFLLANSAGAMIAFLGMCFICGIFYLIWRIKDKVQGIKCFGICVLIYLVAFVISGQLQNYHDNKFPKQNLDNLNQEQINNLEQNVSKTSRMDFWKGSIAILRDDEYSLLFGYGPYSFRFVYPPYQTQLLATSDHPHNIFLKYFVENGAVASLSFILFLSFIFIQKIYLFIKTQFKNVDIYQFLAFVGLSGFLAHQLIDYNLNFTTNIIMFWFLLGIISQNKAKNTKGNVCGKFVIFCFTLSFILYPLSLLTWSVHDSYYSFLFQIARGRDNLARTLTRQYSPISLYEKSEKIWLKRDLYLSWGQFLKYYGDSKSAENILLKALEFNSYDARISNVLGELYLADDDLVNAKIYFEQAVRVDPQNNLKYYYDYLSLRSPFTDFDSDTSLIVFDKLRAYLSQLKLNAYNTILTENPIYAILIANEMIFQITEICKTQNIDACNGKMEDFQKLKIDLENAKKLEENKIKFYTK